MLLSKVEQKQTFIEKYFQEIHFTSQYLAANSETIFFHCITKHPTYLGGMGSSLSIRDSSRKQGLSGSRSQASPWAYHDFTTFKSRCWCKRKSKSIGYFKICPNN